MVKKAVQLFTEQLLQTLQAAEQEFLSRANGRTVCEIGKSASESSQLKAAEGRMQALRDISRILKDESADSEDLTLRLQQLDERWQRFSEISASWKTYKNAGLAEISRLTEIAHMLE